MSPAQEMWTYYHVKRAQLMREKEMEEYLMVICSYIDPRRAKRQWADTETSVSAGFLDDLRKLDPKFDSSKYSDFLGE